MWWPERNTIIPEPGTKVSVRFERECRGREEEWCETRWLAGVVLSHEEFDGEPRAVVELEPYEVENGFGYTPCGRVELVGSVRVHCFAYDLEIPRELRQRGLSLVSPRDGADSSPATAARTG
jgi:hypothetical protein